MGFDLYIVTKVPVQDSKGYLADHHSIVDRNFCTLVMNGNYAGGEVFVELEKALDMDLSFLLEPEYYDPKDISEWEQAQRSQEGNTEIRELAFKEPSGWVPLHPFLVKLKAVQQVISETSDYESRMSYDRKWWLNYFGPEFRNDLQVLSDFLNKLDQQGHQEFSFHFQH